MFHEKNKNVIIISTMHDNGLADESSGKKPEVITYFNSTKREGGVDIVDEIKEEYPVSRINCRWSSTILFALMNIAGING